MRIPILVATAALVLAGTASAGGFATVGVAPLPGDDATAGGTWTPTLTIKQHGRTPLDGLTPTITLRNVDTGATKVFTATATGKPGQYRAKVVFPANGTWTFAVWDDFSQTHTFARFTVGGSGVAAPAPSRPEASPAPAADTSLAWTLGGSLVLAAGLAALLLVGRRQRPGADALAAPVPR